MRHAAGTALCALLQQRGGRVVEAVHEARRVLRRVLEGANVGYSISAVRGPFLFRRLPTVSRHSAAETSSRSG